MYVFLRIVCQWIQLAHRRSFINILVYYQYVHRRAFRVLKLTKNRSTDMTCIHTAF